MHYFSNHYNSPNKLYNKLKMIGTQMKNTGSNELH